MQRLPLRNNSKRQWRGNKPKSGIEAAAREAEKKAALETANENLPQVIARWVKVAKDYPEMTIGKSRLEILLDAALR